jgi:hypothetical protein
MSAEALGPVEYEHEDHCGDVDCVTCLGALPVVGSSPECCRAGLHERTPENTYVSPTGRRQCRPCHIMRKHERRALRLAGGDVPARPPTFIGRILPPEELAELRAKVACVGCGAVRVDRPGAVRAPFTTIRHGRGCPISLNREGPYHGVP